MEYTVEYMSTACILFARCAHSLAARLLVAHLLGWFSCSRLLLLAMSSSQCLCLFICSSAGTPRARPAPLAARSDNDSFFPADIWGANPIAGDGGLWQEADYYGVGYRWDPERPFRN